MNLRTIIGELGTLPVPPVPPHVPPPYYDVNGDDLLTPQADVLPVLDYLNSRPFGEGEGPGEVAVTPIAVRRPSYSWAPGTLEDRPCDACHSRPSSDATLDTGWHPQEMPPATAAQDLGYPAWNDRSADRPASDLDEVFGTDIADLVLDLSQFGMLSSLPFFWPQTQGGQSEGSLVGDSRAW